ncbi:minor tail protein [Arthrobacter phage Argan]|nr:minor tail protein [Arthrobacter phage Argan]
MALTPTDPTKAQIWIRGTAPDQIIDLYVPRGAKGDPGPWVETSLAETTDLNSVVTSGLYKVTFSTQNPNLLNYPTSTGLNGWIIEVRSQTTNTRVIQRAIMTNGSGTPDGRAFYERRLNSGTWSPWRLFASTRVDQTAGRTIYQWDDINAREQLVWGDTGWRDVKSSTINGWTATTLQIRRTNNMVTLAGQISATAATSDHYLPIPTGFAPSTGIYHGVASNTAVPPVFRPLGTDGVNFYVTSGGTSGTYNVQATFPTSVPWPTTLPGTAIGSISNT